MYSVLLVDDEPWAIEGLLMFVDWEGHGFRVCGVCENGTEALSAAHELMPDVIVTDIRMPEMDGLELIEQLQWEKEAPIEFVVLSAYSEFVFAKRAMQLGVKHYLLKPIIEEEAAEMLLQIRMGLDTESALAQKVEDSEEASLSPLAVQRMKDVLQAIEDVNGEKAAQEINSLFRELYSQSFEGVKLFVCSLTVQCSKLIRESGGDPALLQRPHPDPSCESTELEAVQLGILSYAEQIIRTLQSLRKHRPGSTLTEIGKYVSENYRSTLSIRDVAARFYLNPVYLGKAYKEKFGCSLLDQMHDLRISEACEKLLGTNEPIGAIAEQVGYAQYHYFLRHFEQRTGRKPVEYRASKG